MNCKLFQENYYKKYGVPKNINNRFFVSKDKNFIFCEVPKTGITTLKKTLAIYIEQENYQKNNFLIKFLLKLKKYNVHDKEKFILKSPCYINLSQKEFNTMYKFSFVRNPYTRILSVYLEKILKDTPERKNLYKEAKININKTINFKEFLEILYDIDLKMISPHFKPQHIIMCYPIIKYNFIGKFENFENDLKFLLNKFFNKYDIIYEVNHHKTKAMDKSTLKKYYNKETISLVQKIYGDDFLYFNYSLDFKLN